MKGSAKASPLAGMGSLERQFLPAALEILETPPPPLGRAMSFTICAFACCALFWASVGVTDIIAVAAGKIITRARTQVVQAPEIGVVKAILAQPGQRVGAGEALIELDAETIRAELEHARTDLVQARLDEARLRAFLGQASDAQLVAAYADIEPALAQQSLLQLKTQRLERESRLGAIERERETRRAELETSQVLLQKAIEILPLIEERADIRSKAALIEFGSKLLSLEARQQVIDIKAEIRLQTQKIEAGKSTLAALDHQQAQVEAEFQKVAYNDLARALAQKSASTEAVVKSHRRLDLATLRSPMDGFVTVLNVRTVGAIVTPAQQLISIAPENSPLEVEVVVLNRDVAFIAKDQDVEVKVDAYPFTKYGLLKGRVIGIAQDSEPQPTPNDNSVSGSQRRADQTSYIEGSERLLYTVRVGIDPSTLRLDGAPAPLMPGMSVRAEIKTGSRSILEFLMAPLAEYLHQSMRER
jgi:HlyD family secretion protein/hemolysin D